MPKIQKKLTIFLILVYLCLAQNCQPNDQQFLITFHPHLDAFWLNTDTELTSINFVPQYFLYAMNQRNSKTILNSMLTSLSSNQNRKYFITEVFFLKDWYQYLNSTDKLQLKKLLTNKQFQIANGGWVENDEANCYLDDILDQYTVGLNYLKQQFNYQVNIGWATDSFGHSHSQVALQHLLGFEFQAIERVDDRFIHQRIDGSLLQFYWSPISYSNNQKYGGVVTYVRHFLHQVNDLRRISAETIAQDFTSIQKIMKTLYHKPKLFRFLGNDFEQFIPQEFSKLQSAINILNNRQHRTCPIYKYGNPSDYLILAKSNYNQKNLPVREYDFMPNWDQDHYWTGYYTTDPDLKKTCKDFSRLVNLFRKVSIKTSYHQQSNHNLMNKNNQLLALMQHHDGITATAKRHIEKEMKTRMKANSDEIHSKLAEMTGQKILCPLYQNRNKCTLTSTEPILYLSILHEGTAKQQKIQLQLPIDNHYELVGSNNWDIFCLLHTSKCYLVFQVNLHSGENIFTLKKINPQQKIQHITNVVQKNQKSFSQNNLKIEVVNNLIHYTFNNGQFFKISLTKSKNDRSLTQTISWNKYGQQTIKEEQRIPGIYIMANNGQLQDLEGGQYTHLYAGKGRLYTKIIAVSQFTIITLTINNQESHIVDIQTQFEPPNFILADYFLKVESSIDPKNEFYHDMNGYLVMKRKIGERPDYRWQYKNIDKIAANTYPLCSFAYALQNQKKFVIFTDRSGGISLFDKAFILNIDRLTSDDYKGVGEGYMERVKNIFHHKIALISKDDFIERQWQKQYDEPLIAFYSTTGKSQSKDLKPNSDKNGKQFLKYTIYNLNQKQFVLRLINLHEKKDITFPRYTQQSWNLSCITLQIANGQIKESFAHGVPLAPRKHWKSIPGELNILNHNASDTISNIVFKPLQIRSFRISRKNSQKISQAVSNPSDNQANPLRITEYKNNKIQKRIDSLKGRSHPSETSPFLRKHQRRLILVQ